MSNRRPPQRTHGSVAVAIVVALMFASPVMAAVHVRPFAFDWPALIRFVAIHQFELVLGFGLMIAVALLLKTAAARPPRTTTSIEPLVRDVLPRGLDGLA
jgi:hypothetical protein